MTVTYETPLRIGIDARRTDRGLGIATFIRELTHELAARPDVETIVWFGPRAPGPSEPKIQVVDRGVRSTLSGLRAREIQDHGLHVVHFPSNTGWLSPGPAPSVITVHDLIFVNNSGRTMRQRLGRTYMRHNVPRAVRAAHEVAVVSEHTVATMRRSGWRTRAAPTVIYHGIRNVAPAPPYPSRPGFVAFGGADPRKNVGFAIRAFEALSDHHPHAALVILGGAGIARDDARAIRRSNARIEVTGYIPAEEVRLRLMRARCLLYPTSDEGFGLPVLEAMACGTPVVTGLAPVTVEVAGDAMIPIDPVDPVASMVTHMRALLENPEYGRAIAARGLERARSFTWQRSAEQYVDVYRRAIGSFES